ncbi:hypothetical protein R3P38DRAFT_2983542 [Favolaschia claudopus]|uniref:Transcription factor TFIIIC triple barrel domain-containing protein n=1 Tax=Favolaschia claudopus TaxID=2862362 RepID=A0AAW0B095_9AGAR
MAEYSTLCAGYKQVEAFGPDDEYEEEEVVYVTLDLGDIEPSLIPRSSHYRLIGLDTPTPFLQLSGTVFKGRHDGLLGTELLFTEGKDPADASKRAIVHVANTEQRINFKEVRLKPKAPAAGEDDYLPFEDDGRFGVDNITGKKPPMRKRAPRRPRKEKDKEGVEIEAVGETNGNDGAVGEAEQREEQEQVQVQVEVEQQV